ncbi:Asp-tRNA(Asn)/Glu-tRNA(Gln) amidotransferase subunit GatC [Dyadobacter sp. 32]|uniref:Asp-tRNA(Asn)/Glu-tRNA(Gln) amidotransferase subunit GatC n=1 Tax=Dyadobacter sp. 32 TaxID=538966 RepID=UPI0011ECF57E
MKIDELALKKIAHLARLEVKPEEAGVLLQSMDTVLTWMDQLNEINTDGVEPLTHMMDEVNNWREDISANNLTRGEALSNAPSQDGTYIKVPKVIE